MIRHILELTCFFLLASRVVTLPGTPVSIQPFNDGNKRTARIISNAILMENGYCPLSYRSVKASDYKKAMLLFYEQNNIIEFKKIFISQYEYAVNKYFNLDPELAE